MAATITILDTINWFRPFINWANVAIGENDEPALSAANLILQTIVGPPFVWPWNRSTTTFQTTEGTQDYSLNISNYGFLETASIQMVANIASVVADGETAIFQAPNNFSATGAIDGGFPTDVFIAGCTTAGLNGWQTMTAATATTFTISTTITVTEDEENATALAGTIYPLELKWGSITEATEEGRPQFISTQESNESGVTFVLRLLPIPDGTYQVNLTYQESPTLYTGISNTWGIPDQLQYIYSYFFAFLMFDYFDDPRAARYRQLAIAALLSRADGLEATDRNLFLGNWLPLMAEELEKTQSTSQATQGRGI